LTSGLVAINIVPMKILLAYPYFLQDRGEDYDVRPLPIGLYYIGAYLIEHGHQVSLVNLYDARGDSDRLRQALGGRDYSILGVSLFNGNRFGALDLARLAKELDPKVKVVFGGVGATFLWEFFLKHYKEVDYIIRGEGEKTFLELVEAMEGGARQDMLSSIPGLAFRDQKNRPICNPDRPFIEDLDALPDPSQYFTFQHVVSSRGCPWNCTFCGSPRFWKRKVRYHSPRYFVDQLERLYRKGVTFFYVSDDTFTFKKGRVIDICKEIVRRSLGISWYAISRVNCVDEEILYWMKRAGCIQISYGVESGSKKVRDFFNKKITDEDIKNAFSLTRRFGILPRAYFIYGAPGDGRSSIQDTVDLINEIRPLSMVSYILDIYPGTRLYDIFLKKHKLTDDIWLDQVEDIMYFETDPRMTKDMVLNMGRRIKGAFYKGLPDFATSLELEEKEELLPLHASYLARLAMTFTHGDYSRNDLIPKKNETAETLFKKAIGYWPNHDAYLGLGILYQRLREFDSSIAILKEGLGHFPGSEDLNVCMGISLMNKGQFRSALGYLERFPGSSRARRFLEICRSRI